LVKPSAQNASRLSTSSNVLEVGCGSGLLAKLLSPEVGTYTGVDLSPEALAVARRLQLRNAIFRHADGEKLPFPDGRASGFDAAICYDVFTNFPTFADGAPLIVEMLRVINSKGCVLVGSIPDAATEAAYIELVPKVVAGFNDRYGPPPPAPSASANVQASTSRVGLIGRLFGRSTPAAESEFKAEPIVTGYYFHKHDFIDLGAKLGLSVEITDIHPLNPYAGYRFNAIYRKT
jgi:SAM-dependent methyltransferase